MVSLLKSLRLRDRKLERVEQEFASWANEWRPGATGPSVDRCALQAALDLTSDPMLFFSLDLRVVGANLAAQKLTGHSLDRLLGSRAADILSGSRALRSAFEALRQDPAAITTRCLALRHAEGGQTPLDFVLRLVSGESGGIVVARGSVSIEQGNCLASDAGHDHLTALPTRHALERRLQRAQENRENPDRTVAVLFIDIDDFKQVNDCHGHLAGDQVLQMTARRLRACVRPEDTVVRYGGDEFVVVIDRITVRSELEQIAERIRSELAFTLKIGGETVPIAASVGLAASGIPIVPDAILDMADRAMYCAKRARRGPLTQLISRVSE